MAHAADHPQHDGLATTLSIVATEHRSGTVAAVCGWVGDSPIWRYRPAADELVRIGGDPSSDSGVLSGWLSSRGRTAISLTTTDVEVDDVLVVASDGLLAASTEAIEAALRTPGGPVDLASELVRVATDAGADDDVTVAVGIVTAHGGVLSPTAPLRSSKEPDPRCGTLSETRAHEGDSTWWRGPS